MRMLRSLGLFLIACGLFVQAAAHASALPQVPVSVEGACDEMRMEAETSSVQSNDQAPCKNLRLDCLVALGCIPPLALADNSILFSASIIIRSQFGDFKDFSSADTGRGPEPPPPQTQI